MLDEFLSQGISPSIAFIVYLYGIPIHYILAFCRYTVFIKRVVLPINSSRPADIHNSFRAEVIPFAVQRKPACLCTSVFRAEIICIAAYSAEALLISHTIGFSKIEIVISYFFQPCSHDPCTRIKIAGVSAGILLETSEHPSAGFAEITELALAVFQPSLGHYPFAAGKIILVPFGIRHPASHQNSCLRVKVPGMSCAVCKVTGDHIALALGEIAHLSSLAVFSPAF